jgi:carbonic anhydrase/acetyltransferase-like protein (isoleucine patch superfamily)
MRINHRDHAPQVHPSAYVAPGVVLSGDVRIGANSRVLFGSVLTAEGGTISIGENSVVMENAVLRSTGQNDLLIGDHCILGPRSYVVGATIEDEVFLATGSSVFNGAVVGGGSEVRINGTVHLRTTLAPGTTVPIGWIAAGTPAQLFAPEQHEALWAVQKDLDFPGYVFHTDRTTESPRVEMTEKWSRSLGRHAEDELLES